MMLLNFPTLIVIVAAAAVFGLWYESARAREAANRFAVDACRRHSLQLLDGTVALAGLRPRFDEGGLRVERTYVFDYAPAHEGRATGFIIMVGHELRHVGFESERNE